MNVKMADIINSIEILKEVSGRDDITVGVSFSLALAIKSTELVLATFEEKRKELISKFTTLKVEQVPQKDQNGKDMFDDKGQPILVDQEVGIFHDEDSKASFFEALNSILEQEVDINAKPVSISSFPVTFTISPSKLIVLSWLITAPEN